MEMQFRTMQSPDINSIWLLMSRKKNQHTLVLHALRCMNVSILDFLNLLQFMPKCAKLAEFWSPRDSCTLHISHLDRQISFSGEDFFKEDILHCSTAVVSFSSLCVSFSWYSMNIGFRWRRTKFWISNREVLDRDKNTLAVFPLSFVTIQLG